MSYIRERVEKTIKAIAKAESNGKDSTMWQEHLIELIDKLVKHKVRVNVGDFGFCTCTEENGVCFGCRKIKQSCECKVREVYPEVEMKRQYRAKIKGVH